MSKAEAQARYYAKNKEKIAAYQREWYVKNREQALAKSAARQKANPELGAARTAAYRLRHPERIAAYREANKEVIKAKNSEYRSRTGTHPINKAGTDAYKKYRATEKYRITAIQAHLMRTYGITYEDYLNRLEAQGGVCKICGGNDKRKWRNGRTQRMPLFVDHCHSTGRVRGLLCSTCNTGIAMLGEREEMMLKAIQYLKEN